jgi:hypothetical protein
MARSGEDVASLLTWLALQVRQEIQVQEWDQESFFIRCKECSSIVTAQLLIDEYESKLDWEVVAECFECERREHMYPCPATLAKKRGRPPKDKTEDADKVTRRRHLSTPFEKNSPFWQAALSEEAQERLAVTLRAHSLDAASAGNTSSWINDKILRHLRATAASMTCSKMATDTENSSSRVQKDVPEEERQEGNATSGIAGTTKVRKRKGQDEGEEEGRSADKGLQGQRGEMRGSVMDGVWVRRRARNEQASIRAASGVGAVGPRRKCRGDPRGMNSEKGNTITPKVQEEPQEKEKLQNDGIEEDGTEGDFRFRSGMEDNLVVR